MAKARQNAFSIIANLNIKNKMVIGEISCF